MFILNDTQKLYKKRINLHSRDTIHTSGFPHKKGKPLKDGSSMDEVVFYQFIIRATLRTIAAGKKTK